MAVTLRDPLKVMVSGDWHANIDHAQRTIEFAHRSGADTIVQVGDFGFWTPGKGTAEFLSRLRATVARHEIHVYWLDGNHEDHSRREEFSSIDTDYLTYLPRGHRWEWWGKTWMAVGGAVSVDKAMRVPGVSWWPEEELSDADVAHACRPGPVDIVVAHDCPKGVNIPGVGPDTKAGVRGDWPMHVLLDAEEHRAKLRTIWSAHQPELWIHGHYHISYEFWLRTTRFIGLGRDGNPMADTVTFIEKPR